MEKIIFAKPNIESFCFIVVFFEDGNLYLDEAFFAESAKELNQKISENISEIENVRYDVSIFMQDGKNLRELIPNTPVLCYKPKQKLKERIAAQNEWLKENIIIDEDYNNSEYIRFIELFKGYRMDDTCNSIAVDILSDASKYFRRIKNII